MACPTGKLSIFTKDPRINYNLVPGEELMTCPYNLSHAVRPIKFAKHVLNCHRLHCKEQELNKEKPLFSICQYDRSHHVRNAELAFHESECNKRIDKDDGGWSDDEGAKGGTGQDFKVTLAEPARIDEATMKAIQEEDNWEMEACSGIGFNREKRIQQLRISGYNVVNTLDNVGLTKSEKQEFYKAEEAAMKQCAKVKFLERLRYENSETGANVSITNSNPSSAPSSCASAYGYDTDKSLGAIREEN